MLWLLDKKFRTSASYLPFVLAFDLMLLSQKLPGIFFQFFITANYCNLHTIKTELIEIHSGQGMKRCTSAERFQKGEKYSRFYRIF